MSSIKRNRKAVGGKTRRREKSLREGSARLDAIGASLRSFERIADTVPEMMRALREAGVRDLEDLVRKILARKGKEAQPTDLLALDPRAAARVKKPIVHRAPKVEFTVGDVTYDPADVKRFNGQALHFVSRMLPNGQRSLIAFPGGQWLHSINSYFHMLVAGYAVAGYYQAGWQPPYVPHVPGGASMAAGIPPGKPIGWATARFYEDHEFKGDKLELRRNLVWPNLREVSRGWFNNWNDVISSVSSDGATLLMFEDIDFGGDALLLPGEPEAYLEQVGWNDRISSIKNFGNIY